MKQNRKGSINILPILIGVFIAIILGAVFILINTTLLNSLPAVGSGGGLYNHTIEMARGTSTNGTAFLGNIFTQLPLAGTVLGLGLVLALVFIAIFAAIRKSGGSGGGGSL